MQRETRGRKPSSVVVAWDDLLRCIVESEDTRGAQALALAQGIRLCRVRNMHAQTSEYVYAFEAWAESLKAEDAEVALPLEG